MTTQPAAAPLPKAEVHCAQCGGILHPDEGQVFLTCPYCGSAVYLDKSKVVFHWHLTSTVTSEAAAANLRRWMAGNQTVKDLDRKSKVTATSFQYFPMWYAKAQVKGKEGVFLEPAAATSVSELKSVAIPAGDLQKYDPGLDSQALAPSVPYPAMLDWLAGRGIQSSDVKEAALVHLPMYLFKYDFAGKSYTAVVEGASGKVFANIFPAKAETPYFAVAAVATLIFLCVSTFPIVGFAVSQEAGLGLGLLACLGAGALLSIPIFILAAVVSAKV
jgi:DNA-directed RNA polymerase subunit RPC12/RpoP